MSGNLVLNPNKLKVNNGNPSALPFCHRQGIPLAIPVPNRVNPNQMDVAPQYARVSCCADQCSLWNKEALECFDVTKAKAEVSSGTYLKELNRLIELIDGQMRMPVEDK